MITTRTATLRIRLLAVDDRGEREIGDNTFNHTPYAEAGPQSARRTSTPHPPALPVGQ